MTIWKDSANRLHNDMNGEALSLHSWPQGMTQLTDAEVAAILNPPIDPAQVIAQTTLTFENAAQSFLDATAHAWGYDSLLSASSYFISAVPKFKAEATALVSWRDAVWVAANTIMQAVVANTQPMPATVDLFIAMLPPSPTRPVV